MRGKGLRGGELGENPLAVNLFPLNESMFFFPKRKDRKKERGRDKPIDKIK